MKRTYLFLFAVFAALTLLIAACGPSNPQPPQTRTLTLTIEGNGSGTVTFDPAGNPAGACTDDCTRTFNNGTNVTLTAQPAEGSTAAWGGACENATGNTCQVQMNANQSVTVTFSEGSDEPGVTSVTINQANQTLAPGATVQLTANVVVTGGAATTVAWESSDAGVATVSETGLVTAVAEGTATITATSTVDATKSDSITVTVSQDAPPVVESVSIDQGDNLSLGVGDTQTLTATVTPAGAEQGVMWQSDTPSVATVDAATGAVTAVAAGTATITATSTADASKTDTITVTVTGTDGNRLTLTFVGSGSGEVFVDGNRVTETRTLTFEPGSTILLQLPSGSTAIAWGGDCGTVRSLTSPPPQCQLVMDGDKAVTISFSDNQQTASASIVANSVDPAGTSSNDAEEFLTVLENNGAGQSFPQGHILLTSNTLELTFDPRGTGVDQLVGLRFVNLGIPQGATILNAYIQFRSVDSSADDNAQDPLTLTFRVQDSVNPPFFNNILRNISNRSTLDTSVSWTPPAWSGQQAGLAQRSPNLTPLVQALVSNGSWNSAANAIAFIISSNDTENRRDAQSFERLPAAAPQLVIVYEAP